MYIFVGLAVLHNFGVATDDGDARSSRSISHGPDFRFKHAGRQPFF